MVEWISNPSIAASPLSTKKSLLLISETLDESALIEKEGELEISGVA